ncbi:MAG: hypothetical protein IJT79_00320, partial [Ruminococcus sp.]|nr:hypothetical protein [Ruminococcus sp.]
ELYYLQSRYYDPLTGRFLNADDPDYTDTQSGSPLSTNMFAYCENNPISGYDPSGNWDTKDHKKLCLLKNHKFTKLTWSWNLLSDILFNSNDEHSAPFHSRDNLNICKYLFNVAVDFKKTSHKKKKLVEIQISTSKKNKKLKEGYNSDKTKYFIPEKYIAYQSKEGKNSKLEPEYSRTKALIKYLNGKSLSESDKQKIQGKYGIKYKIKNRSDQSKAFLGLALHTVQDYFAHKTYVYYGTKTQVQKYIKNGKIVNDHYLTTTDFNHLKRLGNLSTLRFEDDINKFKWRFKNTKKVTKRLYNLYYGKGYKKVSQYIKNIEKVYYGSKKNIDIYTLNGKKYYFNAVKYKLVVHRDKKRKAP